MVRALLFVFFLTSSVCVAQTHDVLCTEGDGNFEAQFRTGIKVRVGAARNGTFAIRSCAATLSWDKEELPVADKASQVDVDGFGVDLGVGVPVATFQVKKSERDCCMAYRIYALEKPPHLLRTMTGGDFFSAADTDLDGSVEIWTDDAAAVNGFENLARSELDFAPTVVLRFAHGRLLDVSSEFQAYFDSEIAKIRMELHSQDLQDFKNSDGGLTSSPLFSAERLHRLRMIKAKVLEIVWAYLYSGREEEAWRSIAEMWPAGDVSRIRTAILNACSRGIRAQTDGESTEPSRGRKRHAQIFDAVSRSQSESSLEVMPPHMILLRRPPVLMSQQQDQPEELLVDLVIDSAGKVRSAEPAGKVKWVDAELINAASGWKFVPAFKDGRPVACRLRLTVSLKQ
jgi:hypothetical protein